MKAQCILPVFAFVAPALAQYGTAPHPTAPYPYPTGIYPTGTATGSAPPYPYNNTCSDLTSTFTVTQLSNSTATATTTVIDTITSVLTTTVTTSPTSTACTYSGPFINVLGYRTSTCAVGDAGNGFLAEFEDIKLSLVPGQTTSNCGQFGGYVGSVSFLADGTAPSDNCTLLFFNDNSCNDESAFGLSTQYETDRCFYLASLNFQPGSVRMFC